MNSGPGRRRRTDDGFITLELLFLVPFVIMPLLVFAAYVGQSGLMSMRVERAAREAARAASQQLTKDAAITVAHQTLLDNLGVAQLEHCAGASDPGLTAILDTEGIGDQPEGYTDQGVVTVTLACTIDLSIFGPLVSSPKQFRTVAVESVDEYRSRAEP